MDLIEELHASLLLFLDCDSLLEYQLVNKGAHLFVRRSLPLLCQREGFEITTSLYVWALAVSVRKQTRYSHYFFNSPEQPLLEICRAAAKQLDAKKLKEILQLTGGHLVHRFVNASLKIILRDRNCKDWLLANRDLFIGNHPADFKQFLSRLLKGRRSDLLHVFCEDVTTIQELSFATLSQYYNVVVRWPNVKEELYCTEKIKAWLDTQGEKRGNLFILALREGDLTFCKHIYDTYLRKEVCSWGIYLSFCKDIKTFIWVVETAIECGAYAKWLAKKEFELTHGDSLEHDVDLLDPACVLEKALTLTDCEPSLLYQLQEKFTFTSIKHQQIVDLLKRGKFQCAKALSTLVLDTSIPVGYVLQLGETMLLRHFYTPLFTGTRIVKAFLNQRYELLSLAIKLYAETVDWSEIVPAYLTQDHVNGKVIKLLLKESCLLNLPVYWIDDAPVKKDDIRLYEPDLDDWVAYPWDLQEAPNYDESD